MLNRRDFLKITGMLAGAAGLGSLNAASLMQSHKEQPYKISLAQWSLHKAIFAGDLDNLDFAKAARSQFGIYAVEYVNQFFKDKDMNYIREMKNVADGEGVKSLLIMCDGIGRLGDPDPAKRTEAIEGHHKWIDAAKLLGCHSIRVNAASEGTFEEQQKLAADGLARLTEYGAEQEINVIVENHGGLSSNALWLAGVMGMVDMPGCGTLPDFGNFRISDGEYYDRYRGVRELMPWAKAVSAKAYHFNAEGNDITIDYYKMMDIVTRAGYDGYVGIEFEGSELSEYEGIVRTKMLLQNVRDWIAAGKPDRTPLKR